MQYTGKKKRKWLVDTVQSRQDNQDRVSYRNERKKRNREALSRLRCLEISLPGSDPPGYCRIVIGKRCPSAFGLLVWKSFISLFLDVVIFILGFF